MSLQSSVKSTLKNFFHKKLPSSPPKKVLLRLPNWLGDAVMASGVIRQIEQLWPEAKIDLMGPPAIVDLFVSHPCFISGKIQALKFKPKSFAEKYLPCSRFFKTARLDRYDLCVLTTNSFSSAYHAHIMGAKAIVGYKSHHRSAFLTHGVCFSPKRNAQHLVITYQELLQGVSKRAKTLPIYAPELFLDKSDLEKASKWVKEHIKEKTTVIGLNPVAAYGPAKQWPSDRFKELATRLVKKGNTVLIFGDSTATSTGEMIADGLSKELTFNLCGKTSMKEFISLMSCCDGLVTNDSGPMHLAAALRVPLVALFGSTDDIVTGPYKWGHVINKRVECSPCFRRVCPIDFRCMMRIDVDEVEEALSRELEKKARHLF